MSAVEVWLRSRLADGPAFYRDLVADALEAGITERQVRRFGDESELVVKTRVGQRWRWALLDREPVPAPVAAPPTTAPTPAAMLVPPRVAQVLAGGPLPQRPEFLDPLQHVQTLSGLASKQRRRAIALGTRLVERGDLAAREAAAIAAYRRQVRDALEAGREAPAPPPELNPVAVRAARELADEALGRAQADLERFLRHAATVVLARRREVERVADDHDRVGASADQQRIATDLRVVLAEFERHALRPPLAA